jgi:adenine-specific DNA-methyltransferase
MLKAFLSEVQSGLTPNTWWTHEFAGHNKEATLEMKDLFDGSSPFDTAKPVKLLRRILELFGGSDDIILDFFSGSATTAHAVLELNHDDEGHRRFILVQLPEPTGHKQFPTIAEIGKERIRRVIANLLKSDEGKLPLPEDGPPEDLGFKVFKLASSNFRPWRADADPEPARYLTQLIDALDPLVEDWKSIDVIWEVAIKEGYGLNSTIEKLNEVKPTVFRVTDPDKGQSFLISLAEELKSELGKQLGLKEEDLFICRDAALNDSSAANWALQCRLKTI